MQDYSQAILNANIMILKCCYGTGSYPLPPHGLQREILLIVSHPPLKGPYFVMASTPYAEHVGEYLQEGGSNGEIVY